MPCHQHRCCRRPASADRTSTLDYIVLAAADADVAARAATILRSAGVQVERHDLGLRLSARGTIYPTALAVLWDALDLGARRSIRVASIPVGADTIDFQRALLASQSLGAFQRGLLPALATSCTDPIANAGFSDVFKGESLE